MRLVEWTDEAGYSHLSWLRDRDPDDDAPNGLPHDPPDLSSLGLDDETARTLHNMLVGRKLVVWRNATDFKGKVAEAAALAGLEGEQVAQLMKLYSHGPPPPAARPFDLEEAINDLVITERQRDCVKRTFAQAGIRDLTGVENAPSKVGHICGLDIYQVVARLLGKTVP